jgi:hypothetical protein
MQPLSGQTVTNNGEEVCSGRKNSNATEGLKQQSLFALYRPRSRDGHPCWRSITPASSHRGCALPIQIDPAWYIMASAMPLRRQMCSVISRARGSMLELMANFRFISVPLTILGLPWTNEGAISSAGAARWRLVRLNAAHYRWLTCAGTTWTS